MQDIISTLKNALLQAEAGLEVAVGRLTKDGTERGDFKPSEVLALASVREALAMPVTCLHQIQEPEADIWPCVNIDVDESGKITNAKLYSPGLPAGNHDVYPVRVPYMDEHTEAWLACAAELRKHLPEFMHLRDMNGIECAVAAIRELAERSAPVLAAPAAVAVPDALREAEAALEVAIARILKASPGHSISVTSEAKALVAVRAALAATPADHIADAGNMVAAPAGWKLVPVQVPDSAFPWVSGGYNTDYRAHDPRDQKIIEDRAQRTWEAILDGIAAAPAAAIGNPISKQNQQVSEPMVLPEPVATIYTMEALAPGGAVKYHAQVHKALPSGTKLLAEPDVRALLAQAATGLTVRDAVVQWWLATIDQYGNPTLTDGAHRDRAGADQAAYLIDSMNLGGGKKYAVARVELSEPKPSAEGVNHEAIAQNNSAAIAAAKGD